MQTGIAKSLYSILILLFMGRQRQFIYLHIHTLLFCLRIISLLVVIPNIPLDFLIAGYLKPYAHDLNSILHCIIIISVCAVIAKKYQLLERVKINKVVRRNYWLLLLPLLFPGLLSMQHFNMNCGLARTALLLLVLLLYGCVEEIAFRGLVQGYLTNRYPKKSNHRICLITAIFFALIHFNNLQHAVLSSVINQVICAFYTGLFFSALMIRINNIWLLGITHGLLNFLSLSCSDQDLIVSNILVEGSLQDHLVQALGMILLYSPILLIYMLLLKGAKKR